MSRRSFQRITLSAELTLPPGMRPKQAEALFRQALKDATPFKPEQTIIKITKRETIYTN